MPMIGVRELREQTAQVLRDIQENKAEYIVTHQGRPIALLLPLDTQKVEAAILQTAKPDAAQAVEIYERLAESLRQTWRTDLSTQELIDEIRGN
jgi:antitoxin (DNA-binding transcriptional repressor) of toxin-antitoxin stability system